MSVKQKKNIIFGKGFATLLLIIVLSFLGMLLIFNNFVKIYKNNIVDESSSHLSEINAQIKIYVEEKINNDWKVTKSIANTINSYKLDDEEKMRDLLCKQRDLWQISEIYVYMNNGSSLSADGETKNNDTASELVYNAQKKGYDVTILRSTVSYTIPVEINIFINGSNVVALSIVQDLSSFVDNMGLSSFDGMSYVFLTQENGEKISQLTTDGAPDIYNAFTLFEEKDIRCLNRDDFVYNGEIPIDKTYTFLIKSEERTSYMLVTPIHTLGGTWRLFYSVPEDVANNSTNQFSNYITILSIVVMVTFSLLGMIAFIILYRNRQKKFNRDLNARERMLDLLVTKTRNAFALLSTGKEKPIYMSSNAKNIIGDISLQLIDSVHGYQIKNFGGEETDSLCIINNQLKKWNGKEEFVSPFIPYIDENGMERHYVLRLYCIESEQNEFIAIAQDITQEREREEALKNALQMADSASIAKTRFLANMSHDIRTPMNAIVNMTNFAIDSIDDKDSQLEYLNIIKDSADHLLHLINDILDVSRIESGKTSVESHPFDLEKCVKSVCEIISPLCLAKKQSFSVNILGVKNKQLKGDKLKLSQILINLLNNAIKFTPQNGVITFNVTELTSLKSEIVSIKFEVCDTGMGISKDNINHIFEPFVRDNSATIRQIEGSGLGLSICKSYVTAMGGNIQCVSEIEKGSVFTVNLFFEKDNSAIKPTSVNNAYSNIKFDGKRALLVEDNLINQKIAQNLLCKFGLLVEIANNGAEGFEKFISSSENYYDIIYMDIQMPIMNGYEATKKIRNSDHVQSKTIPIIAMTANVFAEDVEMARTIGMNGHIGKPIVINDLINETNKLLKKGD